MMKRIKVVILIGVFLFLVGCGSTLAPDDGLALRKSQPIQLFMGTCVVGRESEASLELEAVRNGFINAPSNIAQNYLAGQEGRAWYLSDKTGTYGLALLKSELCSVYVHQGDPDKIKASMEAWLPPSGSGFTYKEELISQKGSLTTTSYILYRDSNIIEQWLITVNRQQGSGLVAILSYQKG